MLNDRDPRSRENSAEPALVVLAAGLGSRYGSLKQIDQFGPNGETIVDYALFDAIKAGFNKIVFVIRENIESEFKEIFLPNLSPHVEVDYVFQELEDLLPGWSVPEGREKPWGTAHAVWTCREKVKEPFAIVNADDFYGRSSLSLIYNHLCHLDNNVLNACLIGYSLENTLSDHGRVSRGICKVSENGFLQEIVEKTDIYKGNDTSAYYEESGNRYPLTGKETVSMNLMGFTSPVFDILEQGFIDFFHHNFYNLKAEYFIPGVLDDVRKRGVNVPVINSAETWFGVTYQEDKPIAQKAINRLIEQGIYNNRLWN